jgi:predicted Zn-dependent protease
VRRLAWLTLLGAASLWADNSSLLGTLERELERNYEVLREKGDPKPYFISYSVTEVETHSVTGNYGALQSKQSDLRRYLDISVRVGSRELDNYRVVRGERPRFAGGMSLPLEGGEAAVRRRLWLETDRVYRAAAQRFIGVRASQQTNLAGSAAPDFSEEKPERAVVPVPPMKLDVATWERKAREWSALFRARPAALASGVALQATREVKYFVSTEGARLEHGRTFARILITARGKAADGMDLIASETFEGLVPSSLPSDADVKRAVEKVASDLEKLLKAPAAEPYVGPAILSGRAAGVFFHEIFGHRVEGHRQKDEAEGQTFAKSRGTPVLPEFLSVSFDATRRELNGTDLNGWYDFDDEGVKAQNVRLVDNGILKTFLMSRSPIDGIAQSNGHGRKQPGLEVVSRQSNLIVESSRKVPEAELRRMLVEELKKQNKPYGLYFEHVTGGYTTTGRRGLQAFTVIPLVVYRVWADGRPDELVRGADIVGTPLASFAKILATSDKTGIFNGYCGAESGNVPVSAASPALLVSEIEIQKKERSLERPPYLEAPKETRP